MRMLNLLFGCFCLCVHVCFCMGAYKTNMQAHIFSGSLITPTEALLLPPAAYTQVPG